MTISPKTNEVPTGIDDLRQRLEVRKIGRIAVMPDDKRAAELLVTDTRIKIAVYDTVEEVIAASERIPINGRGLTASMLSEGNEDGAAQHEQAVRGAQRLIAEKFSGAYLLAGIDTPAVELADSYVLYIGRLFRQNDAIQRG